VTLRDLFVNDTMPVRGVLGFVMNRGQGETPIGGGKGPR